MSQRNSGYERLPADAYQTPAWCTEAVVPHLDLSGKIVWECAAGAGQMAAVLARHARKVITTDIETGTDFLVHEGIECDLIASNPPYALAQKFIEHALTLTRPAGAVAMLLRCDFDHAKTRQHLFGDCPQFSKKLVLTKRIRWIANSTGSPSFNHAWLLWRWDREGPPTIAYGPSRAGEVTP
jgi:hypothetical protein